MRDRHQWYSYREDNVVVDDPFPYGEANKFAPLPHPTPVYRGKDAKHSFATKWTQPVCGLRFGTNRLRLELLRLRTLLSLWAFGPFGASPLRAPLARPRKIGFEPA